MPSGSDATWLVEAAAALGLPGADRLEPRPGEKVEDAWDRLREATGVTDADLARRLAERYLMDVADLASAEPYAARLIPGIVAVRYRVLPLRYTDRTLDVATCNPHDVEAEREVSRLATRAVRFEMAAPVPLKEAIAQVYAGSGRPADAPVTADEAEASGPAPELTVRHAGTSDPPHVLVVDDDPDTGTLLDSFLSGKGFRVSHARSGPEALALLERDPSVDAVSLDYYMHPMNGLKVLRAIRAKSDFDHLPVVMLTSSEDRNVEMSMFEAGADDYVVKPLDPPRYFLRLRAVMRRRQGG